MRDLWSNYSFGCIQNENCIPFQKRPASGVFDGRNVCSVEPFWFHDPDLKTVAWVWRIHFDIGDPVDVPTVFRIGPTVYVLDW